MERSKRLVYQALEKFFMQRCGLINSATNPGSWHRSMDYNGSYFRHQGVAPYKEWQRFTELFSIHHYHYWLDFMSITKSIQVRRYAQVRMALNAWKIEHGEYPERLSDLVPTYFEVLPVDVLSGNSYAYSAKGLDFKVGTSGWNGTSDVEVVLNDYESLIDPGTPFLLPWAASSQPKLFKCTVTNESSIEPFKCFDYSDPDRFQVHFLRFNIPFALARPQTNSD
jgi:hypothetical protein